MVVLAVFALMSGGCGGGSGGGGGGPARGGADLTISNADELEAFAKMVNDGRNLFYGKTVTVINDIDLSGREWTPIGNGGSFFYGTFDGGGHTISNMTIKYEGTGAYYYAGLFGNNMGTIKNVHMRDFSVSVSVSSSPSIATLSAGGLVGINAGSNIWGYIGGNITNCTASGDVYVSVSSDSSGVIPYAGGLVGLNSGGTITGCEASGDVSSSSSSSSSSSYAGGLVGSNLGGTITGCTASGNVSSSSSSSFSSSYAGGLVGDNHGNITDCEASGNVSSSSFYSVAGGLVGFNYGTITGCEASGDVSSSSFYSVAGGLVGSNNGGTITDCAASGKEITAVNNGSGTAYMGGFLGMHSDGTLSGNTNDTGISPAIGYDGRLNPPGPSDNI
jgi:hypothetical protein